jgi:hypothetical protein
VNSAVTFNTTLQVIARLLTFVAFFLALVLCTIMCLAAAELISDHASVIRDYGVRPVSSNTRVLSEMRSANLNVGLERRIPFIAARTTQRNRDTSQVLATGSFCEGCNKVCNPRPQKDLLVL